MMICLTGDLKSRNIPDYPQKMLLQWNKTRVRRPVSRVLSTILRWMGDHSSRRRIAASLSRPTRTERKGALGPEPSPSLFGLAPGGACHASPVTRPAVRSYRTLSPLPLKKRRFAFCGAFPRVPANGPRAGVTRRLASVEPGLSSREQAHQRSPGRLTRRCVYQNCVPMARARQ